MSAQEFDPVERPSAAGAAAGPDGETEAGGTTGRPDAEVTGYAAEVRAELADLPAEEGAELLEDLEDHLREVAAEASGASLRERLGAPAAYAAELRESAGLAPKGTGAPRPAGNRGAAVRSSLADRVARAEDRVRASRGGSETLDFLVKLRPAWWVLRAWILVRFLEVLVDGGGPGEDLGLVGRLGNSSLLALPLLAGAIVFSVWFARRQPRAGWGRLALGVGQAFLILFALAAYLKSDDTGPLGYPVSYAGQVVDGLRQNGQPVTNIAAYDKDGNLLTGVFLYDQNGRPLTTTTLDGVFGGAPGAQRALPGWKDADGIAIGNLYPLQTFTEVRNPDGTISTVPLSGPAARRPVPTPVAKLSDGLRDCASVSTGPDGAVVFDCRGQLPGTDPGGSAPTDARTGPPTTDPATPGTPGTPTATSGTPDPRASSSGTPPATPAPGVSTR